MKMHTCSCGGFKFYCTYSTAYCAVCGAKQKGTVAYNTISIPTEAPEIDEVVVLSTTD